MNRRLFPLALSLALLAGCAPAPEPTPEPTPTPAAAVDFHTFLDAVNEKRRAVIEDGEPLDVSDWTPAFADQNTTFTDGEMELLLTPHGPEENLTMEQAREDVETAFTLLRTTYGAYEYFGSDQVFDGLREDALARLEEADPGLPLADVVAEALYTVLSPVVRDGHFAVGRRHLIEPYELNTYYVPGVYIDTPAGLSEDYIKPTIGPDGAITYGFFAMSKDGSDLPDTLGDHELNWALCEPASSYSYSREVFYEGQCQGIPMLESRHMSASTPEGEAQLERFASCGGEYADAHLLIFDVRGNPGGSDRWFMEWFKGWTGQYAEPRQAGGQRFSQLRRQNPMLSYPEEWMGTWDVYSDPGRWVEREGYTFLLTDGGTASSGETVVEHLHSVENTLVVGIPSGGCALVPNNMHFYLPNTGVELYFGTGLCLIETDENRDGVGYLPDLWVNPVEAPVAVARLCGYYGLKEPVS